MKHCELRNCELLGRVLYKIESGEYNKTVKCKAQIVQCVIGFVAFIESIEFIGLLRLGVFT